MKYIIITACFFFPILSRAQDCRQEELRNKPGTWKAGMKGSIVNVSAGDLVREKAVTSAIHKMVSSKYKPTGSQVMYASAFGKSISDGERWVADPFYYSLYILRYLCDKSSQDKSKFYVDHATPTTVNISANVIFYLDNLYATNLTNEHFR